MDLTDIIGWLLTRGLILLVGFVVLLFLYRLGTSAIHRGIPRLLRAQAEHMPADSGSADEVAKRIATIEDLLTRLLRVVVIALLGSLALAVFDLWTVLAVIVLVVVAITFATQDVVLDYVMGFLTLVEGPFFKGDWSGSVARVASRARSRRSAFGGRCCATGWVRCTRSRTASSGSRRTSPGSTRWPPWSSRCCMPRTSTGPSRPRCG